MKRIKLFYMIVGVLVISGCSPAASLPTPSATSLQAAPTTLPSTSTSDVLIPAGWDTHTSQQCEYAISYPAEMEASSQNPYSRTFAFQQADPDAGARNFIYVSVIAPEIQEKVKAGAYNSDVYNYDPAATDVLLKMQVGESKSVHPNADMASGFTYQRQPDTVISDHTAQTYENAQPWEFPPGTKEIRYYSTINGCTYLIGGYVDTTGSNQLGAITEDLFHQVVATLRLIP